MAGKRNLLTFSTLTPWPVATNCGGPMVTIDPTSSCIQDDNSPCTNCAIWGEECHPITNDLCFICASKGRTCDLAYFNNQKRIAVMDIRHSALQSYFARNHSDANSGLEVEASDSVSSVSEVLGIDSASDASELDEERPQKRAKYEYERNASNKSDPYVDQSSAEEGDDDLNPVDANTVQCIEELEGSLVDSIEEREASIKSQQQQVTQLKKELHVIRGVKRKLKGIL